MSMTPDGRHRCDRCDTDLGGGGLDVCLVVSDLDPDRAGHVRNLHYCRDRPDPDGQGLVKGCVHKILHPATTKAYDARRKAAREAEEADRG